MPYDTDVITCVGDVLVSCTLTGVGHWTHLLSQVSVFQRMRLVLLEPATNVSFLIVRSDYLFFSICNCIFNIFLASLNVFLVEGLSFLYCDD